MDKGTNDVENENLQIQIVVLDSMAVEKNLPWSPKHETEETLDFLSTFSIDNSSESEKQSPIILLTHKPLHRKDDRNCGLERKGESGHVRYVAPDVPLHPGGNGMVLEKETSEMLLQRLQPIAIFSGHTHAVCRYIHTIPPLHLSSVPEFTLPAFGWRMRPDPSFAVVDITRHEKKEFDIHVHLCRLPNEITMFIVIILHAVILLFLIISNFPFYFSNKKKMKLEKDYVRNTSALDVENARTAPLSFQRRKIN